MAKFKYTISMNDKNKFYSVEDKIDEGMEGLAMSTLAQETIKMSIMLGISKESYFEQMKEHYDEIEKLINKENK